MQILCQGDLIHGAARPKQEADHGAKCVKQSRLLLSVHAAAHDEALHAISEAAADYGVAVRSRCAAATDWL